MCTTPVAPYYVRLDTCPAIPKGLQAIPVLPLLEQKPAELVDKDPELTRTGTVQANTSICTGL